MKIKNKSIALSISICIIFTLLIQMFLPLVSFAEEETIYIKSADDLISLSKSCAYDAWSVGKNILLSNDISLEGVDFKPIAHFGGSFDGGGHTISGIDLTGAYSPAGLFLFVGQGAVINNLTVKATITPDGDKGFVGGIVGDNSGEIIGCSFIGTVIGASDVGGIAGINRVSGRISECSVSGEIIGECRTGGIAGSNEGLISSCTNGASVNTIAISSSLSLDQINISLTLDITKLPSLDTGTMTDVGGISGYSTGIIMGSANNGAVGYPHIGYNVGGICGRSCGHLNGNINNATVNGRKDVGGIVGQMEPHISYDLSEDLLASLKAELDEMSGVIDGAVGSVGGDIPGISTRFEVILENIDGATDSLNTIINDTSGYGNGVIDEINRMSEVLSEVISQLSGITEQIPELGTTLGDSLSSLEGALSDLLEFSDISGAAVDHIISATNNLSLAFDKISQSIDGINAGLGALEGAITISDKVAFEEALNGIADQLGVFINATDDMAAGIEAIIEAVGDNAWMDDALNQLSSITEILGDMSDAASEIYDATLTISENVDLHWDKIREGGDQLILMIGHMKDMTVSLSEAFELTDSGLTQISEGLSLIADSVTVNDPEGVESGLTMIGEGFDKLIGASGKLSSSLSDLSELLSEYENSGDLAELLSSTGDALTGLAESAGELTSAMTTLSEGISLLLSSIDIDFDMIEEGGGIVFAGMEDLVESIRKMRSVIDSMSEGMIALEKAVLAINEAVEVKDESKLSAAFDQAYGALGDIINGLGELSDETTALIDTMREAKLLGDEIILAAEDTAAAIRQMTGALVEIQNGVDSLRENITFDPDSASEGLSFIRGGLSELSDASNYLKNCFINISDAITVIDGGSNKLNSAVEKVRDAISDMKVAMDLVSSISDGVDLLVGYLNGVDPMQIPTFPESITSEANQLFIYISAIENELKYLNTDITNLSGDLVERIGRLNEIFDNLSENIVSAIYGLNDTGFIDNNVSEDEIDSVTYGKLFACLNNGDVFGDISVGGIGGAMGLEYALDPEDDLSGELTVTQKKQYKLKAVIHACQNNGDVSSKYDCAGGIVGKMDLGLVYGSEAYCNVESQSGNYVGGIAGITSGLISQSYAKCTLGGGKYIGGIVGSGISENYSGDSSMVRGCYSMVRISRFTQYAGAISGINSGEYSENLFVSDTLSGIDRVSYAGRAEPISYEELIKRRSIPTEFYLFTLEFVADGKVIFSTEFEYGDSFDAEVFPEIPAKDGHYAHWDTDTLGDLKFDTVVNAVYVPYLTAISGGVDRDKEIFFVEGLFTEWDSLEVIEGADSSELQVHEGFFFNDEAVESWTLKIPADSLKDNTIHYLPEWSSVRIFVNEGAGWREAAHQQFGSYVIFDVSGEVVEIAVYKHSIDPVPIVIIAGSALLLAAAVTVICLVVKKKRAAKKNLPTDEAKDGKKARKAEKPKKEKKVKTK